MKNSGLLPRSESTSLLLFALLFLAIGGICSLPRFGQRENETAPVVSDSDLYIDMARVFVGDAPGFNPEYVKAGPHHYNRPLFPFLAGNLAKYALQDNLRAAFSLVNISAMAILALLLIRFIRQNLPQWQLCWLPSVLVLSGFPQMNWGYHILTDTLGLVCALALGGYAAWLIQRTDANISGNWRNLSGHLVALWVVSAIAFLARETAWIAVVTTGLLIFARRARPASCRVMLGIILAVLLAGKLPQLWYANHFHVAGVPIHPSLHNLLNVRYLLDLSVKTFVCFNLAWLFAAVWLFNRDRPPLPEVVKNWTIATVLYIGAGYAVNSIEGLGYPLRMSYPLFPLVFFSVTEFFERRIPPAKRLVLASGYCLLQYAVNLAGVMLDPAQGKITVLDLWKLLKSHVLK